MRTKIVLCDDPERDLRPNDLHTVANELGTGWTDDLDFAVIVRSGIYDAAGTMAKVFRRWDIGSVHAVRLSPKRTLVLFTHA